VGSCGKVRSFLPVVGVFVGGGRKGRPDELGR